VLKIGKYVLDPNKISVISPLSDITPTHNTNGYSNGCGPTVRHFWLVCDGHRVDFADSNHWQVDEAFNLAMRSKGLS